MRRLVAAFQPATGSRYVVCWISKSCLAEIMSRGFQCGTCEACYFSTHLVPNSESADKSAHSEGLDLFQVVHVGTEGFGNHH